ncbi:unnamed protein product [Sphagnum jensenii]|uniref:Carboxylesterase type B domain-containing protein n=1 Tax=Sphagnum jensenii TaxID=128206 RepID=A0ABP0VMF7_9BRYO
MFELIHQLMLETTTVKLIGPTVESDLIPIDPVTAIASGAAAGIDLMIGTNRDESTLLSLNRSASHPETQKSLSHYLNNIAPGPRQELVKAYKKFPHRSGVMEMTTDGVFAMPSIRVCEMQSKYASTYMYRLTGLPLRSIWSGSEPATARSCPSSLPRSINRRANTSLSCQTKRSIA